MIRTLAVAAAVALLWSNMAARAQSGQVCDGRFERFLKGFTVSQTELMPFLHDDAAVDICLSQLDISQRDHQLISAFLKHSRKKPDPYGAYDDYKALCVQGVKLGCFYNIMFRHPTITRPELAITAWDGADNLPDVLALLETDLPVINRAAGLMLSGPPRRADVNRGIALVKRASMQGDWWATRGLSAFLRAVKIELPADMADRLALWHKAADQGHVPSMIDLARHSEGRNDQASAIVFYRRAAELKPLLFQRDVAEAQLKLARLLLQTDRGWRFEEARDLLRSAAALGNDKATDELALLPAPPLSRPGGPPKPPLR